MQISLYRKILLPLAAVLAVLFLAGGCSRDNAVQPLNIILPTADADVSESVSSNIALDNGGIVDILADVAVIASEVESLSTAKLSLSASGIPIYDSITGTWQLQISRQKGGALEPFQASYTRTYSYQYRNSYGEPQKEWVVGPDTAHSIQFNVQEGNGFCRTYRLSNRVSSMNCNWTATGVNTDTLTINGTCEMAGADTLKTCQSMRTLQYQMTLALTNMRCLRGQLNDFTNKVQGDLSGSFIANVAFMSGYTYGETNVQREMNISLGEGRASIAIGEHNYSGDLATGLP